ncbi:MAG TPA: neutral zinc metallopeptidase [Burkholderiales bacterium]|nr:neutral zinc metallopeptidase [Burkholderiales bacterium]
MRIDNERESENVEDVRGSSGGGGLPLGRGLGVGAVVIALAASYFFGIDPGVILGLLQGNPTVEHAPVPGSAPGPRPPTSDQKAVFVSRVLASTEDTWTQIFSESGKGYSAPKLVLFSGSFPTACGLGQAAAGPFYCFADRKVYIDLQFYQLMRDRFHASGDFAQAYVIAHEVGHHVQNLLGIMDQIEARRGRVSAEANNALSVRLELQADCFAGVWANRTDRTKHFLDPGDAESALAAAAAIGDDTLQQQTRGHVVPDSFTHGTSGQRVRWLRQGLETGNLKACDTFNTTQL